MRSTPWFLLVLGTALCVAAPSLADKTLIVMMSEPGDYIGGGQNATYTEADGAFGAASGEGYVGVDFTGAAPATWWNADFKALEGQPLTVGLYELATRYPFQEDTEPGLSFTGSGRGCNTLTGRFFVHEVDVDGGGAVNRFAADFVQHCGGDVARLVGSVRYQASDSIPDIVDDDADGMPDIGDNCPGLANPDQADEDLDGQGDLCDPELDASFVVLDSDEGDYIGQGERTHWNAANATFNYGGNFDNGVTVGLDSADHGYMTLNFAAPDAVPLSVGVYQNAVRFPFQDPGDPGLSASGNGRGCNTLTGRFEVYELELGPQGAVEVFSADFEQYCSGSAPALHGQVRWRAAFRPGANDDDGDGWRNGEDNCPQGPNPTQGTVGCPVPIAKSYQKCLNAMNKLGALLVKTQGRVNLACVKNAQRGAPEKLGSPATAQDCLTNDVDAKLAKVAAKLVAQEAKTCPAADLPPFGHTGSDEVTTAASDQALGFVADLMGDDLDVSLLTNEVDAAGARCQADVLKRSQALLDEHFKAAVKHKQSVLKGKSSTPVQDGAELQAGLEDVVALDPGGKIAKRVDQVVASVGKRCDGVALDTAFPGCASGDATSLGSCVGAVARCRYCAAINAFDDVSIDCDLLDDGAANASCP